MRHALAALVGLLLVAGAAIASQEKQDPRVISEHSPDSGRSWFVIGSASFSGGVMYVWRRDTTLVGSAPIPFLRVTWPVVQCTPTRIGE